MLMWLAAILLLLFCLIDKRFDALDAGETCRGTGVGVVNNERNVHNEFIEDYHFPMVADSVRNRQFYNALKKGKYIVRFFLEIMFKSYY